MGKETWKAGTMIYPVPAVMVSCGGTEDEYNIITIAWTGTICTNPAMAYISVRKSRHSYDIIKKNMEFVINLTTKDLTYATDICGVKSGKNMDKFKELNLTPSKATQVSAPLIEESPVNIECKVTQILELGSHDMFIAEVLAVNVDDKYIDETGKFNLDQSNPICYSHGGYFDLNNKLGTFGYSVMKKKTKKKKDESTKKTVSKSNKNNKINSSSNKKTKKFKNNNKKKK